MTHPCFQVDELGDLLELGYDDPRRKHLDECPRCRALLTEYRGFMAPPTDAEGADLPDAEKRLTAFLKQKVQQDGSIAPPPSPSVRFFRRTSFRLVMAAAAVVFAVLTLMTYHDRQPPVSDEILLREGTGHGSFSEEGKVKLLPLGKRADSKTGLRWHKVKGADAYRVRLFSVELEELAILGPVTETSLLLSSEEIPKLAEPGTIVRERDPWTQQDFLLVERRPNASPRCPRPSCFLAAAPTDVIYYVESNQPYTASVDTRLEAMV